MEKLIATLKEKYAKQIASISKVSNSEITIVAQSDIDAGALVQHIKNHFIEFADELTIAKINVEDANNNLIDSFASNQ